MHVSLAFIFIIIRQPVKEAGRTLCENGLDALIQHQKETGATECLQFADEALL